MTKKNNEPVVEVETRVEYLIINKNEVSSQSFGGRAWIFHIALPEITSADYYGGTFSVAFYAGGAVSGCGLGIFGQFIGMVPTLMVSKKARDKFVEILKLVCKSNCWGALITTLGDKFLTKQNTDFLASLGFKEVAYYLNAAHSNTEKQKLYFLDIKDLK